MGIKTAQKELSIEQLKEELSQIKSGKTKPNAKHLKEVAKAFASKKQWKLAEEAFQYLTEEEERDLLIADLIEEYLLPAHEFNLAKQFAKFLTPLPEIQPLVLIRIALAENNKQQAQEFAEKLPSPLSRNFAFMHIAEAYFDNNEKDEMQEISKLLLENSRTIFDPKSRSYVLRSIAIDLYLANNEKNLAKEAAQQIPDAEMKNATLRKIA